MQVQPKEGLRLRAQPSTKAKTLIVIPQNSGVILLSIGIVEADGYHWLNVKYAGFSGWVAAEYLKATPTIPPSDAYRFGLHVYPQTGADAAQNGNENLYHTAERLFNLKRPMSFTVLDIEQANRLAPFAKYLIYRPYINEHINLDGDAKQLGEQWVYQHIDKLNYLIKSNNIYIQMTNEGDNCDTKDVKFGDFNLGIMNALEHISRKGVIFNDAVGVPELIDIQNRNAAIQHAKQFNHLIGYHAYGELNRDASDVDANNQKYYSHRYKWLYPTDVKIVLNEAGRFDPKFLSIENTVNDMKLFNKQIASNVVAVNWWQYNGNGSNWNQSVLNSALPSIEAMIKI